MDKLETKHWASLAFLVGFGRLLIEVVSGLVAAL